MSPPKAALFDVDGTLVDTVDLHAEAWVRTFEHFGIDTTSEEIRRQIGKGGDQLLPGLVPPDMLEQRQKEMEQFRADLFKRDFLARVKPFPGVPDLFRRLREAGIKVALASSGKQEEVEAHQKLLGVEELVDAVTTSSDAERSKPFPDIFEAAFRKLGLSDPAEALVIGDTPYDAEAARGGGFSTIGVLCGGFPENVLRDAGCAAVYQGPQHILEEFEQSPFTTGLS